MKKGKVYFIGAGPGDPDLLTIKGKKIIDRAEVIIYAGSLVNPDILSSRKDGSRVYNSASMALQEVLDIMIGSACNGELVARVQTGDTSIYSALIEQIEPLEKHDIEYEIIPGVNSAFASAAALKAELTQPDGSQTVIFSRLGGHTPVPENESLASLSKYRSTMCIFLSIHMIEKVVEELKTGCAVSTPVAVVYKASWKDQNIIKGTLSDIAGKVKNAGIDRQAIIIVGDALKTSTSSKSKLYDRNFSHGCRKGNC